MDSPATDQVLLVKSHRNLPQDPLQEVITIPQVIQMDPRIF